MSRVSQDPRLPLPDSPNFQSNLTFQLTKLLRELASQLNMLSEGKIQAITNSATAAPTSGTYNQGDKIWNSSPTEAGTAGSKYVTLGWVCTSAGSPGTWKEMRTLTGA